MAALMVTAMLIVGITPFIEGGDAAVGDGGSYTYTITYDSSKMSSDQASNSAISVADMTAIYHPSYSGGSTSGYGSWTWNTTTGIGPFNSFYAAFDMTDGNSFYAILNPYNLLETIDGVSIASTKSNYNIMWVLPTVYWSTTSTTLTLTNDPNGGTAYAHTINGHTYNYIAIGVYEGATKTVGGQTVLTSESGSTPTVSQTRATFRTYAHNYTMSSDLRDSSNVAAYSMQWNFYQWELYKYCAWALMENFNSQAVVGGGHTYGSTYVFTTGATDTSGPYAGTPMASSSDASTHGLDQVKLFIEGSWGGIREFVDGVIVNGTSGYYVDTKSTPDDSTTTGTYVQYFQDALLSSSGYPGGIVTGRDQTWGMGSSTTGGSESAGLTDYTYTSSSSNRVLAVGGYSRTDASYSVRYGLSCVAADNDTTVSVSALGSRLAFVFDAGPASNNTLTFTPSTDGYGTISPSSVSVTPESTITISTTNIANDTLTVDGNTIVATPSAYNAQYTYGFTGWSINGTPLTSGYQVTGDVTITADFTRTVNNYTVSIIVSPSGYGTVSADTVASVPYGTSVTSSGSTLTIATSTPSTVTATPGTDQTGQYTYSFDSWTIPMSGTVQGDMTVTAVFTATTNQYTVTIVPNNANYGSVSASSYTVDYGTAVSASGNVLSVGSNTSTATAAASDQSMTYAFSDWTIPSATVTGNMTVTANFTATPVTVTVTIVSNNDSWGTVDVSSVTVNNGSSISAVSNVLTIGSYTVTATPEPDGAYWTNTFDSWSGIPQGGTVTTNITVTAIFSYVEDTYTVTILSNDTDMGTIVPVGSISNIPYNTPIYIVNTNQLSINGSTVTALAADATVEYTYTFDSFNVQNGDLITSDLTITATFSSSVRTYIVIITPNDAEYGSVSVSEIEAPYDSVISVDGDTIEIDNIESTATPTGQTAQYTYAFSSWSVSDGQHVQGDMTITANFTRTVNNYTITFASSNSAYGTVDESSMTVPYGTRIYVNDNILTIGGDTVTATPTTDTEAYDYSFVSWSVSNNYEVTGNVTVTATFSRDAATYTVTVIPNNANYGSVDTGTVTADYGDTITAVSNVLSIGSDDVTATPTAQTAQYTYAFSSWSGIPQGGTVTGNVTITAVFTETLREYTITWDIDGVTTTENLGYGVTPTHADPEKEGYVFAGWDPVIAPVTGNQTYTATWVAMVAHTVTFDATTNGGTLNGPATKTVYNGMTYGTLPAAAKLNNVFLGWFTAPVGGTEVVSTDQVLLDSDITLYAHFQLAQGLSGSAVIVMILPAMLIIYVIQQVLAYRRY